MKHILSLLFTALITFSYAQSHNVTVLYFGVECPSNSIESFYSPDTISDHYMWLESYNGSGWDSIGQSLVICPYYASYYVWVKMDGLITNDYRLLYRPLGVSIPLVLDTLHVDCGHYLGLENYNQDEVTSVEYINTLGQVVSDPVQPGMYIKMITYADKRRTSSKFYINH